MPLVSRALLDRAGSKLLKGWGEATRALPNAQGSTGESLGMIEDIVPSVRFAPLGGTPMHFHLPRPLHGWRAFVGEVGIIVLGVLIALGAEQIVQDLHWRSEARSFRSAVNYELGRNLETFQVRIDQNACVGRRLAELDRLLSESRNGRTVMLLRPIGRPAAFSGYYSVWDNKDAQLNAHLPLQLRLRYGELYDELRDADALATHEVDVWRSLSQFDEPEPLDHSDRLRLRELLTRARQLDSSRRNGFVEITKLAQSLGIKPVVDPVMRTRPRDQSFCQPLLPPKAGL